MTGLCGLLAAAAMAAVLPAEGKTAKRVVFCAARDGACARATTRGNAARGFWGEIGDAELLAGPRPLPAVLYATVEEYQHAMAGLGAREREQAVLHRLDRVSSHPETNVFATLRWDLLRAAAATSSRKDLDILLDAAAAIQGGENRMRGFSANEILHQARERLAALLTGVPQGPLANRYGKEAEVLAQLAAEVHQDPKQAAMPIAEPEQAYFVPSISDNDYRLLVEKGQRPFKWRGGVVTMLGSRDLGRPPWKGQELRLLYPGRRPFLRDLAELTEAQLQRRLQSRMKGVSAQDRADFAADLAFEHAVLCRLWGYRLDKPAVPWLPRWRDAIAMDNENLVNALAAAEPEAGKQRASRFALLRQDIALGKAILRDGPHAQHDSALIERAADLIARLPE